MGRWLDSTCAARWSATTFFPAPGPPPFEGSLLLNSDADTNYVENGDDGSKRKKVDATVGHVVPDASTLSKALRKFLEESQEELVNAAATASHFDEQEAGETASLQGT